MKSTQIEENGKTRGWIRQGGRRIRLGCRHTGRGESAEEIRESLDRGSSRGSQILINICVCACVCVKGRRHPPRVSREDAEWLLPGISSPCSRSRGIIIIIIIINIIIIIIIISSSSSTGGAAKQQLTALKMQTAKKHNRVKQPRFIMIKCSTSS